MTSTPDETTQGCHPFTVAMWNRLPTVYRRADRAQGYRLTDAWHGLNRDPRFITGYDGWYRTNGSNSAWESTLILTRSFRVTPNVPVNIQTWHHPWTPGPVPGSRIPLLSGTKIRHVIRNHTGTIIADQAPSSGGTVDAAIVDAGGVIVGGEDIYDGGGVANPPADTTPTGNTGTSSPDRIDHRTQIIPDRFGVIHVAIHVTVNVPDARNLIDAVHIGTQAVTYDELPAADYFATGAAYPLLRFMDGIGHQLGYLSDMANDMHEGKWSDPLTAPEASLKFLAAVMGVPQRYTEKLTAAQLREHLVDMKEGRSPTPGSRNHIALTAKQWLTGSKDVSVTPAHALETYTGPDPIHTIVVTARKDETPQNDLKAFENFLNDAGVIPAGHRVIVREATNTWDQFTQTAGITWNDKAQAIQTWNQADSAGVDLSNEGA